MEPTHRMCAMWYHDNKPATYRGRRLRSQRNMSGPETATEKNYANLGLARNSFYSAATSIPSLHSFAMRKSPRIKITPHRQTPANYIYDAQLMLWQ